MSDYEKNEKKEHFIDVAARIAEPLAKAKTEKERQTILAEAVDDLSHRVAAIEYRINPLIGQRRY